jgi:hypothetical protein
MKLMPPIKAHIQKRQFPNCTTAKYTRRHPAIVTSQYLRVFQLLWRLKRVESSLATTWTTLQCAVHRTLSRMDAPGAVRVTTGDVKHVLVCSLTLCVFSNNDCVVGRDLHGGPRSLLDSQHQTLLP